MHRFSYLGNFRIARSKVVAKNRSARLPLTIDVGVLNGRCRPARRLPDGERLLRQDGIGAQQS